MMRSKIFFPAILFSVFFFNYSAAQTLPVPAGPYTTGTKIFHIRDSFRFDTLFKIHRVVTIQVWYPAAGPTKKIAPYIPEKKLADYVVRTKFYGLDSSTLSSFSTLATHSYLNAAMPASKEKFPVLLFSPGMGVLRANYTSLFETFAASGVIVVAIDHMYEGSAILPDGRMADINVYPDTLFGQLYADCVTDVSLVVSNIVDKNTSAGKFLKNRLDMTRICSSGHSSGGNIALCAAAQDPRIAAAINLDGGDFTCTADSVGKPCLIVLESPDYSDAELIKKGRDIQKWRADSLRGIMPFLNFVKTSTSGGFVVKIGQTGHMSFSDAPYLAPTLLTQFLGTYRSPAENLELICTTVKTFINALHRPEIDFPAGVLRYPKTRVWEVRNGKLLE